MPQALYASTQEKNSSMQRVGGHRNLELKLKITPSWTQPDINTYAHVKQDGGYPKERRKPADPTLGLVKALEYYYSTHGVLQAPSI